MANNKVALSIGGTIVCNLALVIFAIVAPRNPLTNPVLLGLVYLFFFAYSWRGASKKGVSLTIQDVPAVLDSCWKTLVPIAFIAILGMIISHTFLFSAPLLAVAMMTALVFFMILFSAVLSGISAYILLGSLMIRS